jgi:hypothetical protein
MGSFLNKNVDNIDYDDDIDSCDYIDNSAVSKTDQYTITSRLLVAICYSDLRVFLVLRSPLDFHVQFPSPKPENLMVMRFGVRFFQYVVFAFCH